MIPDFRINFPPTKIDFESLGVNTGQDIDNYPLPSSQARYDYLRTVILGLLAQQASFAEPTQYKEGSPWFDLNSLTLKIRSNNAWVSYAEAIALTAPDSNGDVLTLASWYNTIQDLLSGLAPDVVFSGKCNAADITTIPIPTSLQAALAADSRVFLFLNGFLVNPNNCSIIGAPVPTTIKLSGLALSKDDTFTVLIKRMAAATFYGSNVIVP